MAHILMSFALILVAAGTSVSIVSTVIPYWLVYDALDHSYIYPDLKGISYIKAGLWKMCQDPIPGKCLDLTIVNDEIKATRAFMILTNIMAGLASLLGLFYVFRACSSNNNTNVIAGANTGTAINPNGHLSNLRSCGVAIFALGLLAMCSSISAAIAYGVHYNDNVMKFDFGYQFNLGSAFFLNGVGTTAFTFGAIMFFIDSRSLRQPQTGAVMAPQPPMVVVQGGQPPAPYAYTATGQPVYGQPIMMAQPVVQGQNVVYSQTPYGQPVVYANAPGHQPYPQQLNAPGVSTPANHTTEPPPAYQHPEKSG